MPKELRVVCNDSRKCFAKSTFKTNGTYSCAVLTEGYPDGRCPFCKNRQEYTKGKQYLPKNIKEIA